MPYQTKMGKRSEWNERVYFEDHMARSVAWSTFLRAERTFGCVDQIKAHKNRACDVGKPSSVRLSTRYPEYSDFQIVTPDQQRDAFSGRLKPSRQSRSVCHSRRCKNG
jgi:hypothetical protein